MDEKQLIEKAYEAVELAKGSGKLRKGSNETTKAVEKGIAKLVVVAKDTQPQEIIMHLQPLCEEKKVAMIIVPSKNELGTAAGLPVSCTAVTIIQEGDAKKVIAEIVKNLGIDDGTE